MTPVRRPIDVATRETVAFLAAQLPAGADVLEVGCGEGQVTLELRRLGYQAIGLDSDRERIARAQVRDGSLILASWCEFDTAPVDAIVFTRSLHHISPLSDALGKARASLRMSGMLLVEDFAFEEASAGTLDWFFARLRSPRAGSLIERNPGQFVTDLLEAADPVSVWHRSHAHELHTMAAMIRAIAERFALRQVDSVPYLYRYLIPVLPETPAAVAFVEDILREESRLGGLGQLSLIGRRIVATAARQAMPDRGAGGD